MPNDNDGPRLGPAFFVPYFPGDYGSRPLPEWVVSWECPGIQLDGMSRAARGPLRPGESVALTVEIGNSGTAAGRVSVTFYWLDPSLAFTQAQLQKGFIANITESRAVHEVRSTAPRIWQTRKDLPEHVCLIVRLDAFVDPAPLIPSLNDRHFAQQNLAFLKLQPDILPMVRFWVGNPGNAPARFHVRARPFSEYALDQLVAATAKQPVPIPLEGVKVGRVGSLEGTSFQVELEKGGGAECEAVLPLIQLDSDKVGCVVFEQLNAETGSLVGSLAVLMQAD